MPDRLVIGHINFINVIPVDVELIDPHYRANKILGVPSILNRQLLTGCVDIGFFSSVFYLRNKELLEIPAPYCISTREKAMSVVIVSKIDLEEPGNRKLKLFETPASETSVFMSRVLLKEYFNIEFKQAERDEAEALLLIGDEALQVSYSGKYPFVYDIGEIWKRYTGYPAVFAVLLSRKDLKALKPDALKKYINDLERTLKFTEENRETIIERAKQKIELNEDILNEYYNQLNFRIGDEEKRSLEILEEKLRSEKIYEPA